jgi:glycosyltransferase involved in cell wall biosynthesis
LRIAFVTESFLPATDGVVTRLRYTLDELSELGDESLIIAPKYGEGPSSYAGAQIHRVPAVPFPPYPQIKMAPPNPSVGHALRRFRPDLVHVVNPFVLGLTGVFYARRMRVPLVASYHTNVTVYAQFYGLGFLDGLGRRWVRALHNRARINLCTSETTQDYLRSEGIRGVRFWPQGVDARRFHPDKFSKDLRVRLTEGHPGERLLLYVGRLGHEKNIAQLKTVLGGASGTRLAIVGDGPARGDLEREFRGTPTVFAGMLQGEELAGAYASADAFVFPSTTETLGLAMIEALASGLPVIAARSGATHEVVSEGESGFLYEPGSDEGFVSAVRRVLGDEELRSRLARGARATAEERTWEASTAVLRGYYREAMAG